MTPGTTSVIFDPLIENLGGCIMAVKPTFPLEFWRDLGASCAQGPVEAKTVESWFDINYPKMATYGYRNWRRAVANWWGRVSLDEIEAADHRLCRIAGIAEEIRLNILAQEANTVVVDYGGKGPRFVVHRGGRHDG